MHRASCRRSCSPSIPPRAEGTGVTRAGGITPISPVEQGGAAILHLAAGDYVAGKSGLFSTA